MRRRALFKLAGAAAAASPASSLAQGFPSRAISLVVPYPAGGPTDTLTRIMGEAMQRPLGQSVLVENITGASGAIGVTKVARANPDGYTLSIGHASSHITIWAVHLARWATSPRSSSSSASAWSSSSCPIAAAPPPCRT